MNRFDMPTEDSCVNKPYIYSVVYSSKSFSELENLIKSISDTFKLNISASEMFNYGVFCDSRVYANFDLWDVIPYDVEIPNILKESTNIAQKLEYVKSIISNILQGKINKPEWMYYVESDGQNIEGNLQPSTFLYIEPKDSKYIDLANSLKNFLYSTNNISTFIKV